LRGTAARAGVEIRVPEERIREVLDKDRATAG